MRIWDVHPNVLCRQHLLGEHRELHALWCIIQLNKNGYRNHPETKRWIGKLPALEKRHEMLVKEMERRNYNHKSPLPDIKSLDGQSSEQTEFVHSVEQQINILHNKPCPCFVELNKEIHENH